MRVEFGRVCPDFFRNVSKFAKYFLHIFREYVKIGSCIESKQLEIGSTGPTFKYGCFEINEWHRENTRRRKGKSSGAGYRVLACQLVVSKPTGFNWVLYTVGEKI